MFSHAASASVSLPTQVSQPRPPSPESTQRLINSQRSRLKDMPHELKAALDIGRHRVLAVDVEIAPDWNAG